MSEHEELGGHGDDHGRGHHVNIIVNGQEVQVEDRDLSFAEVTATAYPELVGNADAMFTVAYRKRGNEHHPAGQLLAGDSVRVKEGMVFDVVPTTKS